MTPLRPASRRQFLAAASVGVGACLTWPVARAFAAPGDEAKPGEGIVRQMRNGADKVKVEAVKLRGGVHVLIGSGGNVGVLAGADGLLLVDSGLAGSRPQITKALAGISDRPLKFVVNTHWHFDHCDGNAWARAAGATLIAHPNTKKHLSEATRVPDWDFTFPPAPEAALPTETVADQRDIKINGTTAAVRYYGFACHTDGDLYVRFPDADVLHCGDTFWNGHYPFIDRANGGSIGGTLRATEENLKLAGEKTLVIPGHGPVGGRAELTEYRDMLAGVRDAVAKLKKAGKTADETVAAKPTARWDEKYAGFAVTPEHFTRIAYAGT
ncbi:MAG TPA: MBL fold metallo-hydrolase [Tepidisphaeraceae bacterium]|nr:MBL fold metallo-hydrolase [Tepidisphaeraceae bacterium]